MDLESSSELGKALVSFPLTIFNISYLLYLLESALLSASFIFPSTCTCLREYILPLVQFKFSFLLVGVSLTGFLARTSVTQVSSLG